MRKTLLQCCGLLASLAVSSSYLPAQSLVDAPQPQTGSQTFASQPIVIPPAPLARRYAQVIEPGQSSRPLSPAEKLFFSFGLVARPITLIPPIFSSSYEQVFETDPKYGHDGGAYGEKFGAAVLRSSSVRILSDGVFAGVFHQDPRYYRIAEGGVFHRALLSAEQAVVRRSDHGNPEPNYSGLVGRAAAAALTTTYYPSPSVTGRVVGLTFATSIATDAGGNLVVEFLPNIIRKFPIMKKLRLE